MSNLPLDVVLNVAACAIVSVIILFGSRRADLVRLLMVLYAVLAVILFVVRDGGQINAALALVLVMMELLRWMNPGTDFGGGAGSSEAVRVFDGVLNLGTQGGTVYDTFDPTSAKYLALPQSVNRTGGAQFSYRFWIKIGASKSDAAVFDKTLFLRGDIKKYGVSSSTTCAGYEDLKSGADAKREYLLACPRVYFKKNSVLGVSFNTDRKLLETVEVGNRETGDAAAHNMMSLLYGKFAMLTFTFEDNVDITEFERGVRVSTFVNDVLYDIQTVPGALRVNGGKLYVGPEDVVNSRLTDVYMADMTYYNYALSDMEVKALFMLGHSSKAVDAAPGGTGDLVLSPYNPIDRYNAGADSIVRRTGTGV
jgi:hypothetical protein